MNKLTKEMNHNVLNPECPQNNGSTSVCLCQMFIQKLTNITRHQDPAPKESSQEWEEKFEMAFNTAHSDMVHIGNNSIRRRECVVCQQNKKTNPKGYYKTYLSEQKCYWNDELYQDVKAFIRKLLTEKDTEWHNKWDKHNTERLEAWEKKVKESYEEGYVARGAVESAQKQRMFEAGKILGRKEVMEKVKKIRDEN